jgi:hypothetical protein
LQVLWKMCSAVMVIPASSTHISRGERHIDAVPHVTRHGKEWEKHLTQV